MAVTTVSDLNGLFNTIYENALFVAREQNLMANLVNNVTAPGWMNRVVPIRPQITAVSVAETQDFNSPTTMGKSTLATLTPGEIAAQVVITKRDLETDPDNARTAAEMELGMAMATKIDVDLISTFSSFATDKGVGGGGTATLASLAAGLAVVQNNTKNSDGQPVAVMHPYQWHDIWVELGQPVATQPNFDAVTVQALRDYWVMRLIGINLYSTSNITSGTAAVGAIFTRNAIWLDTRRPITNEPVEYDSSKRSYELNTNAGYAYGLVRSTYGVKWTNDASEPS